MWSPDKQTQSKCPALYLPMSTPRQAGLWRCVEEAKCTFNDNRLQLAVARDPRAVTVSAYFHSIRLHPGLKEKYGTVDQYFQQLLRPVCMWTSIRHLLFTELLADQSQVFFFEDLLADPLDWFGRFLHFVGLNLPMEIEFDLANVAGGGGGILGGHSKGVDEHPGGTGHAEDRTFRDELGPESLAMMDDVMRAWLPPILLKRYGV